MLSVSFVVIPWLCLQNVTTISIHGVIPNNLSFGTRSIYVPSTRIRAYTTPPISTPSSPSFLRSFASPSSFPLPRTFISQALCPPYFLRKNSYLTYSLLILFTLSLSPSLPQPIPPMICLSFFLGRVYKHIVQPLFFCMHTHTCIWSLSRPTSRLYSFYSPPRPFSLPFFSHQIKRALTTDIKTIFFFIFYTGLA